MTRDELIEKVAIAMWEVGTSVGWDELSKESKDAVREEAKAAIDIVLEEAAKVCEEWRPTGGSQEYRKGYAAAAEESAEAIRELKEK